MIFLAQQPQLVSQGLEGYISMSVPAPPEGYGYGVSLYAAAWPLVAKPLRDFQIGLASIWIVPDNRDVNYPLLPHGTVARDNWPERGPSYRDVFQTIEGGLGFWGDTRFPDATAKFRMNGTANGYNHMICSPGWGFGNFENTTALKADQMGIAQLSSRILVPPDGFTFRNPTIGDLFGYAWMVLPLTRAKDRTAGLPVTTGDQSWTLFLNSKNFKGPVAFYTPATWSRVSREYPPAVGRGLDSRPGLVTGGAIEINTVPRMVGGDYSSIPSLQFAADAQGRTVLIHNLTHYSKAALYDQVKSWLDGGGAATGSFDGKGASTPTCKADPLSVSQGEKKIHIEGCEQWVKTATFDATTFGLQWTTKALTPWQGKVQKGSFPSFFKSDGKILQAVEAEDVPKETGLVSAGFPESVADHVYTSPDSGDNCWHKPGPKAGPFYAKLADGSVVTYYWYRFIDQPSLQDADLSEGEKARLQKVAEKIQSAWKPDHDYIPPPKIGRLAGLDPALLVRPPKGLEVGYVPIATHQGPSKPK